MLLAPLCFCDSVFHVTRSGENVVIGSLLPLLIPALRVIFSLPKIVETARLYQPAQVGVRNADRGFIPASTQNGSDCHRLQWTHRRREMGGQRVNIRVQGVCQYLQTVHQSWPGTVE